MACVYCNMDLHDICEGEEDGEECCCALEEVEANPFASAPNPFAYAQPSKAEVEQPEIEEPEPEIPTPPKLKKIKPLKPEKNYAELEVGRGGNLPSLALEGDDMRNVLSTGRKRAAALLPTKEMALSKCHWAGLKYAGGGIYPIIGCNAERAPQHRHHGPDKSVLNNVLFVNLFAVCYWCHNRWHTLNDPTYQEPRPLAGAAWLPREDMGKFHEHDRETLATDLDRKANEAFWRIDKEFRGESDYRTWVEAYVSKYEARLPLDN